MLFWFAFGGFCLSEWFSVSGCARESLGWSALLEFGWPNDELYPWASLDLRREMSGFTSDQVIDRFRQRQRLCQSNEADATVVRCALDEPVCADIEADLASGHFCFFYSTLFSKVGLRLPLNSFEKTLLTELNVAPAQLHPNSWAFVRAFHILCTHFGLVPSANVFLYFFEMNKSTKKVWTSAKLAWDRGEPWLPQAFNYIYCSCRIRSDWMPNSIQQEPLKKKTVSLFLLPPSSSYTVFPLRAYKHAN